jgi:hypothetical protein
MSQFVRIIKGKQSVGATAFRDVADVVFPLVDAKLRHNDKGQYIYVDGTNAKGFPKRKFKMYVSSRSAFRVITEHEAKNIAIESKPRAGKSLKIATLPEDVRDMGGDLVLHADDDDAIKDRIAERFYFLKRAVWDACDGEVTGIVISGPPGVGKSFEVEEALENSNRHADIMTALTKTTSDDIDGTPPVKLERKPDVRFKIVGGHMAPLELFKTLHDYKEPRSVLVFDDCDAVLGNEQSLNLLKRALDTGARERVIDWGSSVLDNSEYEKRFTFNGSVIFITNIDFERPGRGNSALKEHLAAIMDRSYYIDLTMKSLREVFLRIEHVAKDLGTLQSSGLDPAEVDEVMTFFEANIMNFRSVSIRTVQKIAKQYRLNRTDWQSAARMYTFKTEAQ